MTGTTITTVTQLRAEADAVRAAGGTVGFFGTSGNLHEGHLTLIRQMSDECDLSVMPLFLSPVPGLLEFGPSEGYERDFDADAQLAFDAGLNIAFRPTVEERFPRLPFQVHVVPVGDLAYPWENAENPAFMQMAATALMKYWNEVGPCRAYFGEKDWVPLTVLRRMIEDLSMRVELVPCPIVRLADGLCASSRNAKLSADDRAKAPALFAALSEAVAAINRGERSAATIRDTLLDQLATVAPVDYAEVVDAHTLRRLERVTGEVRILVSADFHGTHLFDNVGVTIGS
jgi:pantoate--beta-alanine ligase